MFIASARGDLRAIKQALFLFTIALGLTMLLVVIGGSVYVMHDITAGKLPLTDSLYLL